MSHQDNFISLINSVFTDKNRSISDLIQGASYEEILEKDFNSYFVSNLLKKANGLDLDIDADRAALDDFLSFLIEQEDKSVKVAAILSNLDKFPVIDRILKRVRLLMSRFFNGFTVLQVYPRFTPGATLSVPKGASVFRRIKASEGQRVLARNFSLLYDNNDQFSTVYSTSLLARIPHTVGTNDWHVKIETVPKQYNMSRVIGLGPSSALAWQCGFGDWMTKRLKSFCDIDLSTAPDLHKSLAQEHSLDGEYSTQDQRKASDNILKLLVENLVPRDVFNFMEAVTPSTILVDGALKHTHMLCPAGNGFNTPFQTLLFWALIQGVQHEIGVKHRVYVYGDDVIVHNSAYDGVSKVFPLLGLEINLTKSFKDGPFRESCGGDYLYGSNIRSYYAATIPNSTGDWIKFANGVRRVGYYNNASTWRSRELLRLWYRSILHIQKADRLFCPRHYGDAGINTECSSLYDLQPALKWSGNRSNKYPNNGYDADGNPYSAERIKLFVSVLGGEKTTFAEESKSLPQEIVLRTLSSPFLVGAGSTLIRRPVENGPLTRYPAVFNGRYEYDKKTNVPYTLFGAAPEDIDELFAFISQGAGARISDRETTNKRLYVKELISVLRERISSIEAQQRVDMLTTEAFKEASLLLSL